MIIKNKLSALLILFTLIVSGCKIEIVNQPYVLDYEAEKIKVEKVIDAYANTYENEDAETILMALAHDKDMISLGTDPDEFYIGYQTVVDKFKFQFKRLEETTVYINKREVKIHESGKVAWFVQVWDMRTIAAGSKNFDQGMRLTGVLEKRDEKWVIVQFHNSFPREH